MSEGLAAADAASRDGSNRGVERVVLLTLAAVQFTSIVDFMVVMPLGPQLMRTLGIGPARFGLVVSSYTFAAGVAGLVASSLIDRFGRRAAFLTLYAGFLVGTLLCGLAPSYATLVAARVATGAFGGILRELQAGRALNDANTAIGHINAIRRKAGFPQRRHRLLRLRLLLEDADHQMAGHGVAQVAQQPQPGQ